MSISLSNSRRPLKIFIAHGHDVAKAEVVKWLRRRKGLEVEPLDFESAVVFGDANYATVERIASEGDAAIILATPDDMGRLATSIEDSPRARQNVWMELGWFWGRLGRQRTLLLIKGDVDIPSNYHGIAFLSYKSGLSEVSEKLSHFLSSLRTLAPDSLTEMIYLSSDPLLRDKQWDEIHRAASENLIITGISMRAVRNVLSGLFSTLLNNPGLSLDFVVVDPRYAEDNVEVFQRQHGVSSVRDNRSFFDDLLASLNDFKMVGKRVRVFLYEGLPSFAAVVADGPNWGSTMIAQPFVPKPHEHAFNFPRFKLKRRTGAGVYMTYWNAIDEMMKSSSGLIDGLGQLEEFVHRLSGVRPVGPSRGGARPRGRT